MTVVFPSRKRARSRWHVFGEELGKRYPGCQRFFVHVFRCQSCLDCDPRVFSRSLAARTGGRGRKRNEVFPSAAHEKKELWYPG